jgi:hypothetical protein
MKGTGKDCLHAHHDNGKGFATIAVAKRLDPQEAIVGLKGKESNGV